MSNKKKNKNKKSNKKLPNNIVVMKNNDKSFFESWTAKRNMLNIPHPYKCILAGPPHVGKSLCALNVLLRADPKFDEIYLIHCDETTTEYDEIDYILLDEFPDPKEWDPNVKKLLIIDDIEFKFLNKESLRRLDRTFGYVASHKNLSILLCCQDLFNTPSCVRRMSNFFCIWKYKDIDSLHTIGRRMGCKKEFMFKLMDKLKSRFDFICFDDTIDSPYPFRKNGYEIINKSDYE